MPQLLVDPAHQPESTRNPNREAGSAQEDVPGLIAAAILRVAEQKRQLRDSAVLAAPKALELGGTPRSEEADVLAKEIWKSVQRSRVPERTVRRAAGELLQLADECRDLQAHSLHAVSGQAGSSQARTGQARTGQASDQFISHLSLITSAPEDSFLLR